MSTKGVTILIPVKASSISTLKGFRHCYINLLSYPFPFEVEIVIADESRDEIFQTVKSWFENERRVTHFGPRDECRDGKNDKLNGIYDALNHTRFQRTLLVDDHYRPTVENLLQVNQMFSRYDCFKCMVEFDRPTLAALIDLNGIFIINLLHPLRQFCGHLCFDSRLFETSGFPSRDALFDELAMELHLRKHTKNVYYAGDIFLKAIHNADWARFFEQRVRYAYENMAFPLRFTFFLLVMPLLFVIGIWEVGYALAISLALTLLTVVASFIGQVKYGRGRFPALTFLLAPLWFWPYPLTTWLAVLLRLTGGVRFGGRKITKAI